MLKSALSSYHRFINDQAGMFAKSVWKQIIIIVNLNLKIRWKDNALVLCSLASTSGNIISWLSIDCLRRWSQVYEKPKALQCGSINDCLQSVSSVHVWSCCR